MGLKDVDYLSIKHGLLCGNAYNELRTQLEKNAKNCRAIGSEVRIYIEKAESIDFILK